MNLRMILFNSEQGSSCRRRGSSPLEIPNRQGSNRNSRPQKPQLRVTPIYPPITQNVPKHAQSKPERWCGRLDLSIGCRVQFHDNAQFSYVADTNPISLLRINTHVTHHE